MVTREKNEKYSVTVIALLYLFNKGLLQPEYFYHTQSSEMKLIFQATSNGIRKIKIPASN